MGGICYVKLWISFQATDETDQTELEELAKGGDVYEDWKYECFPNLLDVFNQFHSLKIDATLLLHHLPLLQCVCVHVHGGVRHVV